MMGMMPSADRLTHETVTHTTIISFILTTEGFIPPKPYIMSQENLPDLSKLELPDLEKKTNISALICGICCLVIGIVLFFVQSVAGNIALQYFIIIIGIVLVCFGAYQMIAKSRRWYYKKTGSPVTSREYYYTADDFASLKAAVNAKNFEALKKIKTQGSSNVRLNIVTAKDKSYAAMQLFRYQPFEFKPEDDVVVLEGSDVLSLLNVFQK